MTRMVTIPIQSALTFSEIEDVHTEGRETYKVDLGCYNLGTLYKDPFASYKYTFVGWGGRFAHFHTFEELAKELGIEEGDPNDVTRPTL